MNFGSKSCSRGLSKCRWLTLSWEEFVGNWRCSAPRLSNQNLIGQAKLQTVQINSLMNPKRCGQFEVMLALHSARIIAVTVQLQKHGAKALSIWLDVKTFESMLRRQSIYIYRFQIWEVANCPKWFLFLYCMLSSHLSYQGNLWLRLFQECNSLPLQ